MKFLIAGYGSIGRRHLNNLSALGQTDLLLLRSHHSTLPENEIQDIPFTTSIDEALSQKPDAVIVANPTALHLDIAIPCAKAGCAVLMEKPISHSFERIPELRQALQTGGGGFLTGFQFRFHPGLLQLKRWLDEGRIGKVTSAISHWGEYLPGWHPWEDYHSSYSARADLGGGVVLTLCHPLDYLRWMLGEITAVMATISHQGLGLPVEDTADILLKFQPGATANVHLDYLQRPAQHDLLIIGDNGTLRWDNATGKAHCFDARRGEWEEFTPPPDFERNDLFLAEMQHFIQVAEKREAPVCTLDDGLAALALTTAVHRSAREGCLVKF